MKHAVIVAHPNPDSFNLGMARAYGKAAEDCGHAVVFRDLYRTGFDPCLKTTELPGAAGFAPAADVVAERALIDDVDVFAFVYPLWFNAPPAMLKGYLDRVFSSGFGFGFGVAGNEPLLKGRMMISFSSSGAPTAWVRRTGSWDAIHTLFDEHFAAVCGLSVVDHIHFGEIAPNITVDAFDSCAQEVSDAVRRRFGPSR